MGGGCSAECSWPVREERDSHYWGPSLGEANGLLNSRQELVDGA
jgi:hypothetical protein